VDYLCYVSRSKVDQLYSGLSQHNIDEWVEKISTENDFSVDASADWNIARVVNLFKAGITYGRKGVIQREQTVKLHYVQKLRAVLLSLTAKHPIPSLAVALKNPAALHGLYFHATAAFQAAAPVEGQTPSTHVVSLIAQVGGRSLTLDCSLANFSEGNQPEGQFVVNSTNARFFGKDRMPLQLETVMLLLSQSETALIGTPLFLKLSAASAAVL
jgi:hypothetical protein